MLRIVSPRSPASALLATLLILASSCTKKPAPEREMSVEPIETVLQLHGEALMRLPGVTGVGQGLCGVDACIRVYLAAEDPVVRARIPKRLGGYAVDIVVTGPVRAQ